MLTAEILHDLVSTGDRRYLPPHFRALGVEDSLLQLEKEGVEVFRVRKAAETATDLLGNRARKKTGC